MSIFTLVCVIIVIGGRHISRMNEQEREERKAAAAAAFAESYANGTWDPFHDTGDFERQHRDMMEQARQELARMNLPNEEEPEAEDHTQAIR